MKHFRHTILISALAIPALLAGGCDDPDALEGDTLIVEDDALDDALIADDDALDELESDDQVPEPGTGTQFDLSAVPAPPSEASAYSTNSWYVVCAQDLTVYNGGKVGTLYKGAWFLVDHFGDGYNHVWGWGTNNGGKSYYWGWVYNGWFC